MKVNVTKESVVITECSNINEGEYRVNKCEFQLPQCFEGLTVTAAFDNIPVPLFGGECYIPTLKKGTCTLGVYAYREADDGLELMYSPKPTMFFVDTGSYNEGSGTEEIPEISIFEKYCKEISENAIHKNCIIDSFDVEEAASPCAIYSVKAVNELAEAVSQEMENDREAVSALGEEYSSFTERVENRVSATEEKLYGVGNSLKGSKNSNESLSLEDISPVPHSLKINLSCDGSTSLSDTSVIVRGKNLFGFKGRHIKTFGGSQGTSVRSFDGDGIYVGVSGSNYYNTSKVSHSYDSANDEMTIDCQSAWYGVGIDVSVNPGDTYTVSMDTTQQNARMVLAFYTAAGEYLSYVQLAGGSFTVPADSYWMLCILSSSQIANGVKFKNVQVEKGQQRTTFCKYFHPVKLYANEAGEVLGAESIYPVTIIETGGAVVNISAEYNRDINAAFNELREAIAKLGGSF